MATREKDTPEAKGAATGERLGRLGVTAGLALALLSVTCGGQIGIGLGFVAAAFQMIGVGSLQGEPMIRPVRTALIERYSGARIRSFPGSSRAASESRLSFKVGGTVREVQVKAGDRVVPDDVLLTLDASDLSLQLQEARAGLARAEAAARSANADYARVRELYTNQSASKSQLDGARAQAESADAMVMSSRQHVQMASAQVGYTKLVSKESAQVASVLVSTNENVAPGQPVVVLSSGDDIAVSLTLPSSIVSFVREGDGVGVTFQVDGRQIEVAGIVSEVGLPVMGGTGGYPLVVDLAEQHPELRPGMSCEVALDLAGRQAQETIYLPAASVSEDNEGRFIYVARADASDPELATIERRPVEVGKLSSQGIELLSGVGDGERVVTAGVNQIMAGQKVRLLEPGAVR